MRTSLISASVLAILAAGATPAFADCVLDDPTNIICTDANSVAIDSSVDEMTVTIDPGASLTVTNDDAIRLRGEDAAVVNNGTITATDPNDEAVQADGSGFSFANTGIINSGDKGVQAEGFGTKVLNLGSITAIDEAIEAGDGAFIINGGAITSGEDGINYGDGTLINAGTISGGAGGDGDGVDVDSGIITNEATGRILSVATGSAGIDIDPDDLDGNPVTKSLTITNAGEITGDYAILVDPTATRSRQFILNSGTLNGTGGTALSLAGGDDALTLRAGTILMGDVLFEDGNDLLIFESSALTLNTALFDGGADLMDTIAFLGGIPRPNLTFAFEAGTGETLVSFGGISARTINFELVQIGSDIYRLRSGELVPGVPLPASLPLLLGGLGLIYMRWIK